jgi:hypothetical protein
VPVIAIPLALQAYPRRLTNRAKIFLERNFLEKRDSQMRRQGRKSTAGTGSIEGIPRGTTTFMSVLEMRRAATRALVGDALAIGHDALPIFR